MDQHQPTNLESYAQVLSAYQQAGPWHLIFKHTFKSQWRRVIVTGMLMMVVVVLVYHALAWSFMSPYDRIVVIVIFLAFISFGYLLIIKTNIDKYFNKDKIKHRSLFESYRAGWEFYRYIFFRDELRKLKFTLEGIDQVKPLICLDQQSLSTYVARNPMVSWIYATSGAVIAASATNWSAKLLVLALVVSLVALFILHIIPIVMTKQRRQWELHRWLAWYKAEASKASTPPILNPDGANLPAD